MKNYIYIRMASVLLLCIVCSSCSTGYPRPVFANFAIAPEPLQVLKEFQKNRLEACTLVQTAILDIKGRKMVAIGLCAYDMNRDYIALSLISTTGIKLIEIAEFNGKRRAAFAISDIADGDQAANQIADDIKRIYMQPKNNPLYYNCTKNKVTFIWRNGKKQNELLFGFQKDTGKAVLKEKKIFDNKKLQAAVFYFDHKEFNGKNIPMRIRYENYKFNYNLTLKNQEVIQGAK